MSHPMARRSSLLRVALIFVGAALFNPVAAHLSQRFHPGENSPDTIEAAVGLMTSGNLMILSDLLGMLFFAAIACAVLGRLRNRRADKAASEERVETQGPLGWGAWLTFTVALCGGVVLFSGLMLLVALGLRTHEMPVLLVTQWIVSLPNQIFLGLLLAVTADWYGAKRTRRSRILIWAGVTVPAAVAGWLLFVRP